MGKSDRRALAVSLAATGALLLASLLVPWGCGGGGEATLVFAATRDLEGSGILQAWVDDLRSRSGREIELVTATDLEVLAMARHGECDLLIAHLPVEEERLQTSNHVEGRQEVMRDDFVLVGPPDDPAGAREAENVVAAFRKIAEAKRPFVGRVDGSGTSYAQDTVWGMSGVSDFGDWFRESGEGMEEVLRQASREGAYTLCDRSTFQRLAGELELEILRQGEEVLADPYHAMMVSGLTYPDTDLEGARKCLDYLLSEDARKHFDLGAWEPPAG